MATASQILTGLVGLLHVYFLVLEMFLWTKPFGMKTFRRTREQQEETKVLVCHVPSGNPENAHTIEVGESAVPAHLAHGDTEGACPEETPSDGDEGDGDGDEGVDG